MFILRVYHSHITLSIHVSDFLNTIIHKKTKGVLYKMTKSAIILQKSKGNELKSRVSLCGVSVRAMTDLLNNCMDMSVDESLMRRAIKNPFNEGPQNRIRAAAIRIMVEEFESAQKRAAKRMKEELKEVESNAGKKADAGQC